MKKNRYLNALLAFIFPGLQTANQASSEPTVPTPDVPAAQAGCQSTCAERFSSSQRENFIALIEKTIREIQALPKNAATSYAIISDISETLAFTNLSANRNAGALSHCFLLHTLQLCQTAHKQGCLVIFLSARHERHRAETEKLLAAAGFAKDTYTLYLRPAGVLSAGQWKGSIRSQIAAQKKIIATVDDSTDNLDTAYGPTGRSILVPIAAHFHPDDFFNKTI